MKDNSKIVSTKTRYEFPASQESDKPYKEVLKSGHILEFYISQTVFLITDTEQNERMITRIELRPDKAVLYCLAFGANESWHFNIEISSERDVVKSMI